MRLVFVSTRFFSHCAVSRGCFELDNTQRYIALLKNSLLNETYIENEVRLQYIFAMLHANKFPDGQVVGNAHQNLKSWIDRTRQARQEGEQSSIVRLKNQNSGSDWVDLRNVTEIAHTMIGWKRLENIEHCLDVIRREGVPGDLIETGVWRGGATIFMRGYLAAWDMPDRKVWVADSFEGLPVPSLSQDEGWDLSKSKMPVLAVSLEEVQDTFRRYGLLDERVVFLKGWFKDTLPTAEIERLALLRMDGDLYESTMDACNSLYDKVVEGGFVIVDDFKIPPCRQAIEEFREARGITAPLHRIDQSGVYWRKETA